MEAKEKTQTVERKREKETTEDVARNHAKVFG